MSKKVNIINRKAKFNYELLSKYIAGIVLTGSEIKSIRQNKAGILESFCKFNNKGELYILNMNIEKYSHSAIDEYRPKKQRKLLLNKNELKKLLKETVNSSNTSSTTVTACDSYIWNGVTYTTSGTSTFTTTLFR